jgi:imidazolonepropionase-like amidohydrolase
MKLGLVDHVVAAALVALASSIAVAEEPVAYVGATLFDGTGSGAVADAVVLAGGDRIVAVGPRDAVDVPDDARVVDVSGRWITPGLVDAHIHYFQSGGLYTRPDVIDLRDRRPYDKEMAVIDAALETTFRRYLASGVTAVVDVGGGFWNFEVRAKANSMVLAPRTAVAGPLVSTVSRPQMDIGDPPIIKCESTEEARALVRKQLEHDPDLIKIWFIVPRDGDFSPNLPIIEATIDEAQRGGVRVAVHATQLEAARAAVAAGADVLVHSVDDEPVDEDFIRLVVERGTIYTTTLIVFEGYAEVLGGGGSLMAVERELGDPAVMMTWDEVPAGDDAEAIRARRMERFVRAMAVMKQNLIAMHRGGAVVAAGTDAGNIGTLHGPAIHRELELMAEAGLEPNEILVTVTANAARVFSEEPEFGTLAPGQLADFLILEANPLVDIGNLQHIHRVVKGGEELDPASVLPASPETVVQRQVEAYNARDIDGFLSFFAEDVVIRRLPSGEVMWASREAMRDRYAKRFADSPELDCTITDRIVHGDFVVDHELVTGVPDRPRIRAVATYEVSDGLIQNVWFLPVEE